MRNEQNLLGTGAGKSGTHDLTDFLRRIIHPVNVVRLDQFDAIAERLELSGNEVCKFVQTFEIATTCLDGHELFQSFKQRRFFFLDERKHRLYRLTPCLYRAGEREKHNGS